MKIDAFRHVLTEVFTAAEDDGGVVVVDQTSELCHGGVINQTRQFVHG